MTPPLMRILTVIPEDLMPFYRFPGRFVAGASRDFRPYNRVVVRRGVVDPEYRWQEDGSRMAAARYESRFPPYETWSWR